MRNSNHKRQGDVYITRVNNLDLTDFKPVKPVNGNLILAYGEVTGHHHALIDAPTVKLYRNAEGHMIIEVEEETELTHQEHSSIALEPGMYKAYTQEEYDPEGMRRVHD